MKYDIEVRLDSKVVIHQYYIVMQVNEPVFNLEGDGRTSEKNPPFPLPWDLPLSAYAADDLPWVNEYLN